MGMTGEVRWLNPRALTRGLESGWLRSTVQTGTRSRLSQGRAGRLCLVLPLCSDYGAAISGGTGSVTLPVEAHSAPRVNVTLKVG